MLIQYGHHGLNIGQMVVNSVVHGMVYGVIYKALHGVSLPVIVGAAVVVIGFLWFMFGRK